MPKPPDYDERKKEIVERVPPALSDYFCFGCATCGKSGLMHLKGAEDGLVDVLTEEFDESALDGYRQSNRTQRVDVYVWECDNCGGRVEDTLGY